MPCQLWQKGNGLDRLWQYQQQQQRQEQQLICILARLLRLLLALPLCQKVLYGCRFRCRPPLLFRPSWLGILFGHLLHYLHNFVACLYLDARLSFSSCQSVSPRPTDRPTDRHSWSQVYQPVIVICFPFPINVFSFVRFLRSFASLLATRASKANSNSSPQEENHKKREIKTSCFNEAEIQIQNGHLK